MTYQVLARKWRPQNFTDMVGQDHISSTLCNAIKNDRVGHAYLFVGTRGTGKTTTARIFAKAINCENPLPDANPCDQCTNCKEITAGSCMDVLEIDGASNNGVDDIRRLRDNVQYTPARCSYKVYIIDEVHMLSTAAWNALLKTLEEPPEHVKFLFATTEVHKVLPTILSRCQRFDLKRISQGTISRRLQEIAQEENAHFDQSALNAIARAANGGMRDALSIMDQMIAFCNTQELISEHDVSEVFGLTSNHDLAKITIAMLNDDAAELIKELNHLADVGRNLEQLYSDLLHFSRNLMICAISGNQAKSILDLDDHELSIAREIVTQTNTETLQRMVDGYLGHDGQLRNTLNKRVFLEMTLVRIMKDAHAAYLNDILKRLNTLRKAGSLSTLEVDAPKQTISVSIPEPEKKTLTESNLAEEKPLNQPIQEVTPIQETVTTAQPSAAIPEEVNLVQESIQCQEEVKIPKAPLANPQEESILNQGSQTAAVKEPNIEEIESHAANIASKENIQEVITSTHNDNKPDYLNQIPQKLQTENIETIPESSKLIEESTTEIVEELTKAAPSIVATTQAELKLTNAPLQETNYEAGHSIEKITIDDTITLNYKTLIDTDYISKARLKDPGQFGLQRYQSDFDENEETPGSALGVFYYKESSNKQQSQEDTHQDEPQTEVLNTENCEGTSQSVEPTTNNIAEAPETITETPEAITETPEAITETSTIEESGQQKYIPEQYTQPETTHTKEKFSASDISQNPEVEHEPSAPESLPENITQVQLETPEAFAARIWQSSLGLFSQQNSPYLNFINELTPISFTANTFILTTEQTTEVDPEIIQAINSIISQVESINDLDVKIITASPDKEDFSRQLSSNEEVWGRVNNNPLFTQLCQEFDGTIIDVRG